MNETQTSPELTISQIIASCALIAVLLLYFASLITGTVMAFFAGAYLLLYVLMGLIALNFISRRFLPKKNKVVSTFRGVILPMAACAYLILALSSALMPVIFMFGIPAFCNSVMIELVKALPKKKSETAS